MQSIPLVYAVLKDLKLHAGPAEYSCGKVTVGDTVRVVTIDRLKTKAERGKVLVWDVEGMNRGRFNAPFIEFCKVSGNDLWLIEPVYDDNDVLDAFIGSADKLVFPYERIRDDSVLEDILGISDNCIPMLTSRNGGDGKTDLPKTVEKLSDIGFHNIMVFDSDGSLTDEEWDRLKDLCGGLVAYSPLRPLGQEMHLFAEDVFPFTAAN